MKRKEILANIFTNPEMEDFATLVDRLTSRRQGDSENLADFIADLRRLSAS